MRTTAVSFLIGSSSFLQVTWTTIKSRMTSKFGQIRPLTVELAAIERLETNPHTYNGRHVVNTPEHSCLIGSSSFLQATRTCITAWMGLNFNQIRPLTRELPALVLLNGSDSFLQVTRTTVGSRMSSNFGQIRPWTAVLDAIEHLKKIAIDLQREKYCEHSSAFIFDLIFFVPAGNKDMHKSLNEFEFQHEPTTDYKVNCPLASEKIMNNVVNTLAPSFLI